MIKIFYKAVRHKDLSAVPEFLVGSWVYVESPEKKELSKLAAQFDLDYGLLTDAIDPYEVPRIEIENDNIYIFARFPFSEGDSSKIITIPILILIGKNFLITVCNKPLPYLDNFISGKVDINTTQKTKLFLQLFSQINTAFENFLININRQIRKISIKLEDIQNKDIIQFVIYETILNDFSSALIPNNNIFNKFLHGKILKLYEEDKNLIEDLVLTNGQLIEISQSSMNTISNIRDAYSNIMTNNLNRIIKLLTALTIILNIPMIISSIYGMNVKLPMASSPFVFWQLLISTLLISIALLIIFSKKQWL